MISLACQIFSVQPHSACIILQSSLCCALHVIGLQIPEEKIFKGFYHIWAWWTSWSCDPNNLNKLSLPHPKETPHKIWLQSTKWLLRNRSLKILNLDQGLRLTLTFDIHKGSYTHLVDCIYQL